MGGDPVAAGHDWPIIAFMELKLAGFTLSRKGKSTCFRVLRMVLKDV
jgi:hypothetical protein